MSVFTQELQFNTSYTSYELLFTYESRISDYWTSFFQLVTIKVCLIEKNVTFKKRDCFIIIIIIIVIVVVVA